MSTYTNKTGHPGLGIFLGIVGILFAILPTLIRGVVGMGISVVLGIVAVLLGMGARKGGRGMGAIITGVIAVLLAVVMLFSSMNLVTRICDTMKDEITAQEQMTPEINDFIEGWKKQSYMGIIPIINLANNKMLQTQFDAALKKLSENAPAATATPAPAAN